MEQFISKHKLHDESVSYLKILAEKKMVNQHATVEEMRSKKASLVQELTGDVDFEGSVKEFKVPSSSLPDGIPVDVIIARVCSHIAPIILVYFHGGGFVVETKKDSDPVCKVLSRDIPCIVVNVEYRLSPENKFPAALEDGKNVVRWVMMNKSLIGGTNDSKVGVCGVSAGGNIVASLCHEVLGIAFQVLVYPWLDLNCQVAYCENLADEPIASKERLTWFAEKFVNSPDDMMNPKASPLLRTNFTSLPPTLLLLAEFDFLRDQAYEYKRKLKEQGVDAESLMIKGSVHGFFVLPGHFRDLSLKARERLLTFLKKKVRTS